MFGCPAPAAQLYRLLSQKLEDGAIKAEGAWRQGADLDCLCPAQRPAAPGAIQLLCRAAQFHRERCKAGTQGAQREASRPAARGEQQPGRAPMFGSPAAQHSTSTGTGALLLELRAASKPAAGNTFFTAASESLVTGYNAGPHPHDAHNYKRFGTCTLMCSRFDWPV
ncbi:unnamed protein product [Prorocentrum cordatum]|uniref:Uncharacterized protein n=1 Tax=Prorocentrum cordatum TaxID=2364126 RepID=A0ABN9X4X3_9DINO|nr:unnamed protein product [Polarella glacialis]